ncbi:unnamed protein product [Microthlaspi erraticum]|uniref:Uncharacterized protein n=1 Tax=Microthlaspi erraticum TaxID=1685480 RepID=A0A6D2HJP3_9BRAS|nr:unnamed protein product [Microthlaspi erraticum]
MIICAYRRRGALTLRCREEVELVSFTKENKSRGRVKDMVKKSSVKYGSRSVEFQSFDTQRHLATDFPGNLKRISVMRSVEIVVSELSSFAFVVEVEARELRRETVRLSSDTYCLHRVFMADTGPK